jgi:hypothetical protein
MAEIGTYGEAIYQEVLPLHGPDTDGMAHAFIGAVTHPMREIDELVRDTPEGDGWGVILDVDDAPVKGLYWLAQLAGVLLRERKIVADRSNYIVTPSAEVSLDLTSGGATTTREATGLATHGAYHFHGTRTGATEVGFTMGLTLDPVPAATYTFSADILRADAPVALRIRWFDSGASLITEVIETASTTLGRRVLHATAPGAADNFSASIVLTGTTIGNVVDFDGVVFEPGTTDGSYFDGDSPDGEWLGTPHESASLVRRPENDEEWGAYARDAIRRQGGKQRGKPDAILSAVEDTLTGTRHAVLLERVGGNAYALTLITRPSETPDPALTAARAETQKPAGMIITHTLTEFPIIDEGSKAIDSGTATIDTAAITDVAD